MIRGPIRARAALTSLRAVLTMLALVSQLALGSIVLPEQADAGPVAALDALSVLCSPDTPPGNEHKPLHRPKADFALCPARVGMALHGVVLASAPALPAPPTQVAVRSPLQQRARGPLSRARVAAQPRGPPLLT